LILRTADHLLILRIPLSSTLPPFPTKFKICQRILLLLYTLAQQILILSVLVIKSSLDPFSSTPTFFTSIAFWVTTRPSPHCLVWATNASSSDHCLLWVITDSAELLADHSTTTSSVWSLPRLITASTDHCLDWSLPWLITALTDHCLDWSSTRQSLPSPSDHCLCRALC
jgi:hypothetical protein